jgi:hypothetical protein
MITSSGPTLDEANRTVRDTSARLLRLLRDPNRDRTQVYDLQDRLGDKVHRFTGTLVYTLIVLGYKAYISSKSRYLVLDEKVYVELGNDDLSNWYTVEVWSFTKPRPRVRIVGGYYDGVLPPLTVYEGAGVRLGSMQELIDCLAGIAATIDAYRQCTGCHYSSGGGHCGLGRVPAQVCIDRQLSTGD